MFITTLKSVKRQYELKTLQDLYDAEQRKVLKYVCTRWLSIGRCLQRLMQNWDPLLHFSHEEKENQAKAGKKQQGGQTTANSEKTRHNNLLCEEGGGNLRLFMVTNQQAVLPFLVLHIKSL